MTAALANAIDPRDGHLETATKSLHVQVPLATCIAASDALRAHAWRPIAEAPKDGPFFLLGWRGDYCWMYSIGKWVDHLGGYTDFSRALSGDFEMITPTHWQPLPAAPGAGDE